MKIGLVSIHAAHNYGSVLQAYALQEKLREFSDDVEIINYRPEYFEYQYKLFSLKVYKRYKGIKSKILHFGWRILKFRQRYIKYKKFEEYISKNYKLSKKYKTYSELLNDKMDYDVFFCGSDQIWNTDITEGFDKTFYLGFVGENKIKASYAASLGRKNIDLKYKEEYKEYLNKFDYISLREASSIEEISKFTNKPISVMIDPTLLMDKQFWNKIANNSKIQIPYPYIFVYILEENDEFVKIVNAISKRLGLRVVSVSKKKRFNNEKIIVDAGPYDFLKLFKEAQFVITNSFHGTVFSLIYEKRNCIIPHKGTGSRMIDLMNKVGLSDRVLSSAKELDLEKITLDINYQNVELILKEERKKAEEYIKNAIRKQK